MCLYQQWEFNLNHRPMSFLPIKQSNLLCLKTIYLFIQTDMKCFSCLFEGQLNSGLDIIIPVFNVFTSN